MLKKLLLISGLLVAFNLQIWAQEQETSGPVYVDSARVMVSAALSKSKLIPPSTEFKIYNPRNRGINKVVPGKGLPTTNDDTRQKKFGEVPAKSPLLSFDAITSQSTPTDPTGAAGPNHYVNAWNSGFSVFDKSGNQISPPASLASIGGAFTNEVLGDPIVVYDEFADRFLITQFSDTPKSFLVAVSQGPDPVNDGWFTYRFTTNGVLPDYPKISVWSDGYYITTNKNSNTAGESQVIYAIERDEILQGGTAQIMGFPLPGIRTNGFYSPAGFQATGEQLPAPGNAPIVFMQDDAWAGVSEDHLKIWLVNVDWNSTENSSISESQELTASQGVSPFIATFDGGSFSNLSQPFDAPEIDVLQATMMHMTPFRKFGTHNSVVMKFVVDIDGSAAEHAGIRWYELRQGNDGALWYVHQEGTYAPDKSDRFSGSIGIDAQGNIGLGYTVLDDSAENPIFPSIRYTGRYANDELGIMTIIEESIVEGNSPDPNSRYGDYSHLSIDPVDGVTFWHNAEYFEGIDRVNRVGVFKIAPDFDNDIGVIAIVEPRDATLTNDEEITISIRNFGRNAQSNFLVGYTLDGGERVTEIFTESIPPTSSAEFTFSETVDLSEIGRTYEFTAFAELDNDEDTENDSITEEVRNLPPVDVGVTSIDAPQTGQGFGSTEEITITIENFGGEPQSNIPVSYQIGNNIPQREVFEDEIPVGENRVYIFSESADLSVSKRYLITARTNLDGDSNRLNDSKRKSVANLDCIPVGSDCSFGDGISFFELSNIRNERIPCGNGYEDFLGDSAQLDRAEDSFTLTVGTYFQSEDQEEKFSLWIDLNDNGSFEEEERLVSEEVIPTANRTFDFVLILPENAPLGQHLLRIRAGDTNFDGDLNDPCDVMEFGTTHDYLVNITDSTLNIDDFFLNEADMVIISEDQKEFRVIMETSFDQPLRITVHNVHGQKIVENQVENIGDGYVYDLDMSYAARGVYLVRLGTRKVGKVQRIIVR